MSDQSTVTLLKQRLEKAHANKQDELEDPTSPTTESCKDCLERLDQVEMTMDILTETLIGATVTKFKSNPTIGSAAKALIQKWKQIAKATNKKSDSPAAEKPVKNSKSKAAAAAKTKPIRRESSTGSGTAEEAEALREVESEWSDLPLNRQKICEKLFPLLFKAKPELIQAGMNVDAIDQCLARTAHEVESAIAAAFHSDRKGYADKARSIAFNLKNNVELAQNLVFGAVQGDELVKMTAEQLASSEQRKVRAEQAKKLVDSKRLDWDQANEDKINEMCGIKGDLLKASLFTCGRCKSVKTTSTQKQTRSADEPMTVFVLCLNCGKRWKC